MPSMYAAHLLHAMLLGKLTSCSFDAESQDASQAGPGVSFLAVGHTRNHQTSVEESVEGLETWHAKHATSAPSQRVPILHRPKDGVSLRRPISTVAVSVKEHPAGWFGAFSESESTFDEDGGDVSDNYPDGDAKDGWAPDIGQPNVVPSGWTKIGMPSNWFSESASGGPQQAWQTYYPPLEDVYPRLEAPPWKPFGGAHETFKQLYQPGKVTYEFLTDNEQKDAAWFDSLIKQYDYYGRLREPSPASAQRYIEWTQRTRTTPLRCGPIGCVANATLKAFDTDTEIARHCRLNIRLHATDFDDEYSRENLEWVSINSHIVTTKCDPMASECNTTIPIANRPMYPCLSNFDLHDFKLLNSSNGNLNIAGKLSPMVDECPVDGNLLSGLVSVTCFVKTKPEPPKPPEPVSPQAVGQLLAAADNGTVPLRCTERGCVANAAVFLHEALQGKTCKLTVTLLQTDFDNDLGSGEEVEWVKVENETVAEHVKPGRNPCKERAVGASMLSLEPHVLIDSKDVTDAVREDGMIEVSAKISDMVDECGANGFLLNGEAQVICT